MSKEEVRALTRPDPFLQRLQGLGAQVKSHQTVLLASIVAFLLLGIVVVVVQSRAEKTHDVASRAFADAQKTFDKAPALTAEAAPTAPSGGFATREEWRTAATGKFEAVIKDHAGSGAARMSHLYLAQLVMDKGDAQKAVDEYKAFLADTKASDPLFGAATLGYAAALEDAGKTEEALAEYRKLAPLVEDKKALTFADEALMAMARIFEKQGKAAEAKDMYERVTKDFPTSMARYKAKAKLDALGQETAEAK